MDATPAAIHTMAETLPKEGTTAFLATTMTQEKSAVEEALRNAAESTREQEAGKAEVLGVHLEGPFISPKRAGAQHPGHIITPDAEQFRKWQDAAEGGIKLVTMAPERDEGHKLVRMLADTGVVASVGHSNGTFAEVVEAEESGARHVTHLFNGMTGLHHREPGVAGAALLRDKLKAEMIVDGVHICPEMVGLAFRQKGAEGLILITDSIRAKGLENGTYDLGGQDVSVKNGEARLEDGTLAGSVLRMEDAVRNVMEYSGCTLRDAIQMASENPARQLRVFDRKGSLAEGKDADIVILDERLEVAMTLCKGKVAYKREGLHT
jgi:N-acetylglucosamine-6-phosphate deacetylase